MTSHLAKKSVPASCFLYSATATESACAVPGGACGIARRNLARDANAPKLHLDNLYPKPPGGSSLVARENVAELRPVLAPELLQRVLGEQPRVRPSDARKT